MSWPDQSIPTRAKWGYGTLRALVVLVVVVAAGVPAIMGFVESTNVSQMDEVAKVTPEFDVRLFTYRHCVP